MDQDTYNEIVSLKSQQYDSLPRPFDSFYNEGLLSNYYALYFLKCWSAKAKTQLAISKTLQETCIVVIHFPCLFPIFSTSYLSPHHSSYQSIDPGVFITLFFWLLVGFDQQNKNNKWRGEGRKERSGILCPLY